MPAPIGLDERVRLAVYHGFAETGSPPTRDVLAASLDVERAAVDDALSRLRDARHLVIDERGEIVLAHPFAAISFGFSVMGTSTLWWGGCAWDAFAIPNLVEHEPRALVATTCPGCARPLAWTVGREGPPPGDEVAHFLVPMARVWDDVIHTCRHQRLFCGDACVTRWTRSAGVERGYVMDLAVLWRLASRWYAGRLDAGYVRREPAAARDYFREVGLGGAFWGLEDS